MTHLFHESVIKPRHKPAMRGGLQQDASEIDNDLERAARSVLADARHALASGEFSDAERVHALRRAFKRWRALLRLLHGPVGEAADAMRAEARDLMRQLSSARDQQSALDALDDLTKGEVPLSPASLRTMRERLTALRDAAQAVAMTPDLQQRITGYLETAESTIGAWRLPHTPFGAVAEALASTYRRARRLLPEDWEHAIPEDLHALRRRVVEHRHQMELIEPLWPRFAKMWGAEAQRLRNQLGACQDLAVLSGFLAPHQPLAHWRARMMPAIEARGAAHLRNAERLARRLFAERPRAFRKRIGALWKTQESGKQRPVNVEK
jgi:CHAD domain-containing protein